MSPAAIDIDEMSAGVRARVPAWVARAITLVESARPDHRAQAQALLAALTPYAGASRRIGITGVPGAGKSTFIDTLGSRLTSAGHRVAVLAVDPSSTRNGGSILGDKTRMARLATDPAAFVRPSPTAGTLGGVTRATREAVVVVEAAGYDIVVIETVGVGQSETAVADMVDSFLLLTLARTGDQLQGIKKGVLELADVIAVNKADGPHVADAQRTARELAGALRLLRTGDREPESWQPPVVTCSAVEGTGIDEVWAKLAAHHDLLASDGAITRRRRGQQVDWMWALAQDALLNRFHNHPAVRTLAEDLQRQLLAGLITPGQAAEQLLAAHDGDGAG